MVPGRFAVARLDASASVPDWALTGSGDLAGVVRRGPELSIVCAEQRVPAGVTAKRGYVALAVRGPLDFSLTGILAALAAPLAEAGIPIFAISTYDTDVLLVADTRLDDARRALEHAGHILAGVSRLS
ncbi:ACT domain-containing protein [Capillimicrobium parvum]|uniref:ACT domain-containing protein n=1 Tax=Capillimicrobium parvum TaxID=2884022 RepID=UPI00216AFD43|nr:ACT domain-containing protein [Capillimicrobium parvum]